MPIGIIVVREELDGETEKAYIGVFSPGIRYPRLF